MQKRYTLPHISPNDRRRAVSIYNEWQNKAKTSDEFEEKIYKLYDIYFGLSESQTNDIMAKMPGQCRSSDEFIDKEERLTIELGSDRFNDLSKRLPWNWINPNWDENDLDLWQRLSDPEDDYYTGEPSWKQPVPTKSLPDLLYNSKRIVDELPEPRQWEKNGNKTGLVLGSVQSGKTASMLGVSSIILDKKIGYQILIVLGGHTENLRTQTLERFEVFNKILRSDVHFPVRDDADLKDLELKSRESERRSKVDTALGFLEAKKPVIFVIKKNTAALSGLIAMMEDIHKSGESYPTLIIDDESDHSSLNTKRNKAENSTIHRMIGDLRDSISKNAYLGYTATPQGILLSSPKSKIFPKDFLWLLDPHDKYIGPDDFFNHRSAMIISTIDSSEYPNRGDKNVEKELSENKGILPEWQKKVIEDWDENGAPTSINAAIIDFILTGAVRWDRSDKYEGAELPDHSLMFHVNRLKDIHKKVGKIILNAWELCYSEFNNVLKDEMKLDLNNHYHRLIKKRWDRILRNISITRNDPKDRPEFEDLSYHINLILQTVNKDCKNGENHIKDGIRIINSDEGSELPYSLEEDFRPPRALILIGGDLLSRGLTIEGLCVSYYLRMTKNPSVDTELQRCRWFGAKSEYVDLLTLHIQEVHVKLFRDINDHNKDLMDQMRQATLSGLSGAEVVFMLKTRDSYQVTGYSKRGITKKLEDSYSGNTVSFNQPSVNSARYNINLLDDFLGSLRKTKLIFGNRGKLWENVDSEKIIKFLKEIKVENSAPRKIHPHDLSKYLKKWKNDKNKDFPEINIIQRFGKDTMPISQRRRDLDGRDGNWYPLTSFTHLPTAAAGNWPGCWWGDAVDNNREDMDKRKMNAWFKEGNSQAKKWQRSFKSKRRKGAPILFVFYKLDKNYIHSDNKNNTGKGKWYLDKDEHSHLIANDDLVTFIASLPTGGPTGGGIVNPELYGSAAMKMIAGRELEDN